MIDTMVFAASFAAGTYTKGQLANLSLIDGPSVVRDGNGKPTLKRVITVMDNGAGVGFPVDIHIKNGNWDDEIVSPAHLFTETSFQNGKSVQYCGDDDLVVNSAFYCQAEIRAAATTTSATDVFAIIEIDYDGIPAVPNPETEKGRPVTLELKDLTVANTTAGAVQATGLVWNTWNVDIFKAGYRYLLTDAFVDSSAAASLGFLKISGAAGQGGLKRVIPMVLDAGYLPVKLLDSVPMVKGPMDLAISTVASAAITADVQLDYIRR